MALETDEQYWARCIKHFDMLLATGRTKWRNPSHDNEVTFHLPLPPLDAGASGAIDWAPGTGQKQLRKPPIVRVFIAPAGRPPHTAADVAKWRSRALVMGDNEGCIWLPSDVTMAVQQTRCDQPGCSLGGFRCVDLSHSPRFVVGGLAGNSLARVSVSGAEDEIAPEPLVSPLTMTAEERLLARAAGLR